MFSFLENLLGIKDKEEKTNIVNSQTIPLLEATINPDTNAGKGGGDITILNNNALLPDSGPLGTIADINEKKQSPDQISIYVVRKGDTLSKIAEIFDVSVNTIRWANDIKSGESISSGQTLIILPVTGVQYTIKKGDTLKSIAKKLNSDINEIMQFNDLIASSELAEGQIIMVPNGDLAEETPKTQPKTKTPKGTNAPFYAGYYMRPITDGVKSQKIHGYNGVDLADSCGTPIMASASGDIIISRDSGWNAGYGKYAVISHPNSTQTLYAHMSKIIVSNGWHVTQGQIIGYMGTTGRSTGCHVHFEIRGAKNPF